MISAVASSRPIRDRRRAATFVVVGVCTAALLAVGVLATVTTAAATVARPFAPSEVDGLVPEGVSLTVADDAHPAIAQLEPSLRDALRAASEAAGIDGVRLEVTSGWRSGAYQRWLFEDAVRTYGDPETAGEYVAAPEDSTHVTGRAVDIGGDSAEQWLEARGWEWGLCRTYANERWHFERVGEPGGQCPDMVSDASVRR